KPFPKRLLFTTMSGVVLLCSIYMYEMYFFTFSKIDRQAMQEGPGPVPSPSGAYIAHAYYEPYGGAAGGVNVWVDIISTDEENRVQTVYYGDAKTHFTLEWVDNDTLFIQNEEPQFPNSNRNTVLVIGKESYHETGLACQSVLMKKQFETCYHN